MNDDYKIIKVDTISEFVKKWKPNKKKTTKKKTQVKPKQNKSTIVKDDTYEELKYISENSENSETDSGYSDEVEYTNKKQKNKNTLLKKFDISYAYQNSRFDKNYYIEDIDPYLKIDRSMYMKNYLGL